MEYKAPQDLVRTNYLVLQADQAMYSARQKGKNRFEVFRDGSQATHVDDYLKNRDRDS
jgi:hypothetical protein